MDKRGMYFFVIDAFIGAAIVLISLFVILSSYSYQPSGQQPLTTLEDFLTYLQNTEIRDFEGNETNELIANGTIDNPSNTLFEQVAEFHNESDSPSNNAFMAEIVGATLPEQMSMKYIYGGDLIYEKAVFPLEESGWSLSSKKISMVTINGTHSYGPHMVEVIIWTS